MIPTPNDDTDDARAEPVEPAHDIDAMLDAADLAIASTVDPDPDIETPIVTEPPPPPSSPSMASRSLSSGASRIPFSSSSSPGSRGGVALDPDQEKAARAILHKVAGKWGSKYHKERQVDLDQQTDIDGWIDNYCFRKARARNLGETPLCICNPLRQIAKANYGRDRSIINSQQRPASPSSSASSSSSSGLILFAATGVDHSLGVNVSSQVSCRIGGNVGLASTAATSSGDYSDASAFLNTNPQTICRVV